MRSCGSRPKRPIGASGGYVGGPVRSPCPTPELIGGDSPLRSLIPSRTIPTLVVLPLIDTGGYRGYVLWGSGTSSFARDLTHDFLINVAHTAGSAYRAHDDLWWRRGCKVPRPSVCALPAK